MFKQINKQGKKSPTDTELFYGFYAVIKCNEHISYLEL